MTIRNAAEHDVEGLARLWHQGWQDAHAGIVPEGLERVRTPESFRSRIRALLPRVRMAEENGAPVGFTILKEDELYQLYVAREARGSGMAGRLVADALHRLRQDGVSTAWLACAIGNERAARFYEKSGWRRAATVINRLETPGGIFEMEVWRYEFDLAD